MGLWERTAKGLTVCGKEEDSETSDVGRDFRRGLRLRGALRFTLVAEGSDGWTGSV